MRCHYCDHAARETEGLASRADPAFGSGEADMVVEKDGVRVGLCEAHFRERLEELADSPALERLGEELDIDRE